MEIHVILNPFIILYSIHGNSNLKLGPVAFSYLEFSILQHLMLFIPSLLTYLVESFFILYGILFIQIIIIIIKLFISQGRTKLILFTVGTWVDVT